MGITESIRSVAILDSLQPARPSYLRIFGARFGATQGSGTVSAAVTVPTGGGTFVTQTFPVTVLAWSDTTIDVKLSLPAGAPAGLYTVTVQRSDGRIGSDTFTVTS